MAQNVNLSTPIQNNYYSSYWWVNDLNHDSDLNNKILSIIYIIAILFCNTFLLYHLVSRAGPRFYQNTKCMIGMTVRVGDLVLAMFPLVVLAKYYIEIDYYPTCRLLYSVSIYVNQVIQLVYCLGIILQGVEIFFREELKQSAHKTVLALIMSASPWLVCVVVVIPVCYAHMNFDKCQSSMLSLIETIVSFLLILAMLANSIFVAASRKMLLCAKVSNSTIQIIFTVQDSEHVSATTNTSPDAEYVDINHTAVTASNEALSICLSTAGHPTSDADYVDINYTAVTASNEALPICLPMSEHASPPSEFENVDTDYNQYDHYLPQDQHQPARQLITLQPEMNHQQQRSLSEGDEAAVENAVLVPKAMASSTQSSIQARNDNENFSSTQRDKSQKAQNVSRTLNDREECSAQEADSNFTKVANSSAQPEYENFVPIYLENEYKSNFHFHQQSLIVPEECPALPTLLLKWDSQTREGESEQYMNENFFPLVSREIQNSESRLLQNNASENVPFTAKHAHEIPITLRSQEFENAIRFQYPKNIPNLELPLIQTFSSEAPENQLYSTLQEACFSSTLPMSTDLNEYDYVNLDIPCSGRVPNASSEHHPVEFHDQPNQQPHCIAEARTTAAPQRGTSNMRREKIILLIITILDICMSLPYKVYTYGNIFIPFNFYVFSEQITFWLMLTRSWVIPLIMLFNLDF